MMSGTPLIRSICLVAAVALVAGTAIAAEGDTLVRVVANDSHTTPAPASTKTTTILSEATSGPPAQLKLSAQTEAADVTTVRPSSMVVVEKHEVTAGTKTSGAPAISIVIAHSTPQPAGGAVSSAAPAMKAAERIGQYFEPMCANLEGLQAKQMFKIQSQMKQFVEKVSRGRTLDVA